MDIDDLLAEVAVDSTPQESRDLQELTRCWVAERVAPEILPWPTDLMARVLERIARQVSSACGGHLRTVGGIQRSWAQSNNDCLSFLVGR